MCCAGRGGSCELMIGCVGKATSDELNFDRDEMDDVRWVTRAEAASALRISEQKANPYLGEHEHNKAVCRPDLLFGHCCEHGSTPDVKLSISWQQRAVSPRYAPQGEARRRTKVLGSGYRRHMQLPIIS